MTYSQQLLMARFAEPSHFVMSSNRLYAIENARATARKWGIYRSDAHFNETASMSLYLYPYAPADRVEVAVLFNTIGFFLDDGLGHDKHQGSLSIDKKQFLRQLESALSNPHELRVMHSDPAVNHLLKVSFQILKRVYKMSNWDYCVRFRNSTLEHWQESFSLVDEYTSVSDFVMLRRRMGGMYPMIDMLEFAYDVYLPDELLQLPHMNACRDALADMGGLSNELFSYPKEVMEQGAKMNFVSIIQHAYRCNLDKAVGYAIDYVNQCTYDFIRSANHLLRDARELDDEQKPLLKWYVKRLYDIAWASYAWQVYTERYNHPAHIFMDKRASRHFQESQESRSTAHSS